MNGKEKLRLVIHGRYGCEIEDNNCGTDTIYTPDGFISEHMMTEDGRLFYKDGWEYGYLDASDMSIEDLTKKLDKLFGKYRY